MTLDGPAPGVELDQLLGHGLDGFLGPGPGLLPGVRAQLVERGQLGAGLGELLDEVEVLDRHEQLVAVAVVELDELPALALDLDAAQAAEDADAVIRVDDVVAGLEVLELGEEGPARGPADDDLLLGEDVLLGEEVELFLGVAEASGERPDEERNLVARRDRERRLGLDDGDLALAEQRGHALAGAGAQQVDGAEVALGLEPLEVLEEEGDLVVEAGHRLEGEGVDRPAGRGAQVLEADGLLADALAQARREDRIGVEGESAVGDEVGVLFAEPLEMVVPLAIDGLGVVDDEDRVGQIIGDRSEAIGQEQGQGGEARAEVLAVDGLDLPLEVAAEALGPLAGGRLPEVEEVRRGRELAQTGDGQPVEALRRALGRDVELAERGDARAVELDAEGIGLPRRKDVDDAAAPSVLARRGDQVLVGVAEAGQGLENLVMVGLAADLEREEEPAQVVRGRDGFEQAPEGRDDDRGRRGQKPAEKPHPRGHRVEGRRDLEIGVLGERRQGGEPGVGGQAGQEEAAGLLGLEERGRFGTDEDDRAAGRPGQAGQEVGLGRLDDAVNGERPVLRSDGPSEIAEFGGPQEKIEAHRTILQGGGKPGQTMMARGLSPQGTVPLV